MPVPLAWHRRSFQVRVEGGELITVSGHASPPFGSFEGTPGGPASYHGSRKHILVYLPEFRPIATVRIYALAKALTSELARAWVKWGAKEPPERQAEEIIRAVR